MKWPWTKAEDELEREIRHHIETLAEAYQRQGVPRDEALRQARVEFGGVEQIKEECRDIRAWNWLAQFWQDIRFGTRMLRKTPAITLAAVFTLAVGIGATTTILSLADAILWRTLAVPAPQQLFEVLWEAKDHVNLFRSSSGGTFVDRGLKVSDFFSRQGFEAMQASAKGDAEVAGHLGSSVVSTSYRGVVAVAKLRGVTGNFFLMLQLQPERGRLLVPADDRPSAAPVVVATHRFWKQRLDGSPDAVGRTMRIDNTPYTIAGILPADFTGIEPGDPTDLYAAMYQSPDLLAPDSWYRQRSSDPMTWWMQLMARRAPNASPGQLRAMMDAGFASSWASRPQSENTTPHIRLTEAGNGLGSLRRNLGDPVLILLGLVALVLAMACANIANLLLARAASREKEAALRVSLGCGRRRLIRQFFTESLLLATIGGALSIPIALLLTQLMVSLLSMGSGGIVLSIEPDIHWLAATAMVALLTALVFGLYPAVRTAQVDAGPALKEGSGSAGTLSRSRWLPAKVLVLVQVSIGALLVTSAILFTGHLTEIVNRDTGFERGHALLFDVRPGEIGYEGERLRQFYLRLDERLSELPGVQSVGLSRTRPMRGGGYWDRVMLAGQAKGVQTAVHHESASFLAALGVPILKGRNMTASQVLAGDKVAVISEDVAQALNLAAPVGMRVEIGGTVYNVVGVAKRARYSHMTEEPLVVYVPFDYTLPSATVLVRTEVSPVALLPAIRNAVKQVDRDLPLVDVYTMDQQIARTLQRERLFAWLCGSFGVLALVLCVVGMYGLMAHTTARRVPEIGIRMALGATRGDVTGQVLREGLKLAGAGLVLGVPLALYGAKLAVAQKLLPEGPMPYASLAVAIGILGLSAFLAVLAPAIRASSVDPAQALHQG